MISIITRAGEDAEPTIFDLYLCVRNQNDFDFEWIVLVRPDFDFNSSGLRLRLNVDPVLNSRTKIIETATDSRGELLNIGLSVATGTHFVVVDDDDIIASNFVRQFNLEALNSPKKIIRTIPSRKIVEESKFSPGILISYSKCEFVWPSNFDLYAHLGSNKTPCLAIAFPTIIAKAAGLNWDPQLDAVEDWDFLLKFLTKTKVVQIPISTSIYRQLKNTTRSKMVVKSSDWEKSENIVRVRLASYMEEFEKMYQTDRIENLHLNPKQEFNPIIIYIAHKLQNKPLFFKFSRCIYLFLSKKNV